MLNQILYTASVTPFDVTGEAIDYTSLEFLLRLQASVGNGIVLFGSTGEGLSLSTPEKQAILRTVMEWGLNTEILVGVPNYPKHAVFEWIDFCNELPITGYLMTTPMYTKPGVMGQTRWFEMLFDRSAHPVMVYNIPGRTGVRFHTDTVKHLCDHDRFVAIKDSGGTIESVVEYRIAAPAIALYCGDDYMMPAMAVEGAVGLVSVASNAWAQPTRDYVLRALKSEVQGEYRQKWWQACHALFTASNPIPIKALLADRGLIAHDTVRLPLSMEDFSSCEYLLAHDRAILAAFDT